MAKRYKINKPAIMVTSTIAKSGTKWEYAGRTDNIEKAVNRYESMRDYELGIRITDTETNKVVYEDINEELIAERTEKARKEDERLQKMLNR